MHGFAKDLLLALMIGAEVFAIAALWPLSEWAVKAPRQWGFALALFVIMACVALDTHGAAFPPVRPGTVRWVVAHALDWTLLPLFLVFPDAICVASAQSLTRAGMPARYARATALCVAAVAVIVAPFATIVAGCGLAGACF
jgi:hypothetical protein